jgi:hypothetical protein
MTTLYKRVRLQVGDEQVFNDDVEVAVDLDDALTDASFRDVMEQSAFTDSDAIEYVAQDCDLDEVLDEFRDEDGVLEWVHNNVDNDDIVKWAEAHNYVFRVKDEPIEVGFRQSTELQCLYIVEVEGHELGWVLISDDATFRVKFADVDSGHIPSCPKSAVFPIVTGFVRFHEKTVREFIAVKTEVEHESA